MTARCALCMVP